MTQTNILKYGVLSRIISDATVNIFQLLICAL